MERHPTNSKAPASFSCKIERIQLYPIQPVFIHWSIQQYTINSFEYLYRWLLPFCDLIWEKRKLLSQWFCRFQYEKSNHSERILHSSWKYHLLAFWNDLFISIEMESKIGHSTVNLVFFSFQKRIFRNKVGVMQRILLE